MTEDSGKRPRAEALDKPFAGRRILVAAALVALFALLLDGAGRLRQPIVIDIGPSTGRYGSGFLDSEETPPTTFRWTRQNAELTIPLEVDASLARFSVRAARYLDDPTHVTVTLNGKLVTGFDQSRGRQRTQHIQAPFPAGRLNLGLSSADPNLGVALDWIRVDGLRWRVPIGEWTVWILPVGLFAALLLCGASLGAAAAATAAVLGGLAAVAAVDPFGFVHAMRDVGVPAVIVSLLAALAFRGQSGVVLAIAATVLVKGSFLFHPSYFYNDVRQNDRYVGALRSYEGSIMERSRKAQVDLGVGYPRVVGGKKYAFPYSPAFYLPFTALPADRDLVVRAIKQVALFSTALEVALAFVLARWLVPAAATLAAWLTFAFPILTSRMLYAMWSTLAGHALDLLVVVMAVRLLQKPKDARAAALLFAAALATCLTYVSSLFNTSAFLIALAVLASTIRWRLIGVWLGASLLVVLGLYGDFTLSFIREILPAIFSGSGPGADPTNASGSLPDAFARIVQFAGWGFPCFAAAGLLLVWRRADATATALKAWFLAFIALVLLRGLSSGLFKDLKEIEYAGPAFAILAAVALARVEATAPRRLIALGLVVTGLLMQWTYFEAWSRLVLG